MEAESDWFWKEEGVCDGESESNGAQEGSAEEEALRGRAESDRDETGLTAVEV